MSVPRRLCGLTCTSIPLVLSLATGCGDDTTSTATDSASDSDTDASTTGGTETPTTAGPTTQTGTDSSSSDTDSGATTDPTSDSDTTTSDSDTTTESESESESDSDTGEPVLFKAGVGMRYVDGPVGISMAGYGGRIGANATPWSGVFFGTKGFYGFQTVKAMVVEDADGDRMALLKIPTMSSESSLTDGTVAKLKELYDIDLEGRIFTGATHSHHTNARYWRLPDIFGAIGADTPDEEVIDKLSTTFAEAIKDAIDDLDEAEWAYGYQDDWDPADQIYRDRRSNNNPTYPKDPRLTMLAVRRPGGEPMAAIINFGMHGIVFGTDNELLTEDAPGGLELKFEEAFYQHTGSPILGMFIQSGGGDASPSGGFLGHSKTQKIEMIGETAAPRILELYDSLEWQTEGDVAARSRRIDLRFDKIGYNEYHEFEALGGLVKYEWGGFQCQVLGENLDDDDPNTSMEGKDKTCIPVNTMLGGDVPHQEVHTAFLTTGQIGDFFLVSIPGEPAYSVVKYLREQVEERSTPERPLDVMAYGYSQDHLLYFTHPDDWFQAGYEAEMSLWGPLAGKYIVDTQMSLVDDLLDGVTEPVLTEDSPHDAPGGFSPRGFEQSQNQGEVLTDVPPMAERTERIRFGFGGGDPSIASPIVRVQVDADDNGTFVDVPHPAGWAGKALDNTRYHMITHYDPEPAPNGQIAQSRAHNWYIDWEIPDDLPAGTYRLVASGRYFDGNTTTMYEATSSSVVITQSAAANLDVSLNGSSLTLDLTLPPTVWTTEGSWPVTGWRLFDHTVGPDQPIHVQAPLSLEFLLDGEPQPGTYEVVWTDGAYVFDLADADIAPDTPGLSVRAYLAADIVPSDVTAEINP